MVRQNIKQELKEKDNIYNLFKDQLQKEYWNRDRNDKGGKLGGHERVSMVTKKAQCIKQRYGSYDQYSCDDCGVMLNVVISGFIRDKQKSGDIIYFLFDVTEGKAYTLNENPRTKDFKGAIPLMTEWDHFNPKDKTIENSKLWKSINIEQAYTYFLKTRPLCVECHRKKNSEEEKRKKNQKLGILSHEDFLFLLKTEVKPYSKYHYIPPKEGAKKSNIKKYGKGALAEALERAEKNKDTALVEDLKRMSRRPDLDYKEYNFKWSEITGNISTHEINKEMRDII
jgi:hypothetical protein